MRGFKICAECKEVVPTSRMVVKERYCYKGYMGGYSYKAVTKVCKGCVRSVEREASASARYSLLKNHGEVTA